MRIGLVLRSAARRAGRSPRPCRSPRSGRSPRRAARRARGAARRAWLPPRSGRRRARPLAAFQGPLALAARRARAAAARDSSPLCDLSSASDVLNRAEISVFCLSALSGLDKLREPALSISKSSLPRERHQPRPQSQYRKRQDRGGQDEEDEEEAKARVSETVDRSCRGSCVGSR